MVYIPKINYQEKRTILNKEIIVKNLNALEFKDFIIIEKGNDRYIYKVIQKGDKNSILFSKTENTLIVKAMENETYILAILTGKVVKN